ncbi:MAG: ferredoxin--NADP reductase [Nocardioides sp.]|nr:ferredoxin--NADP reductase [Nocardioides sp.]
MATESFVLKVLDVVEETADSRSVVFERPAEQAELFDFKPGQFLTVAVPSDQTGLAARCYSLSSTPADDALKITVKRTVDGYASNWICDNLQPGDTLRVLPPSGIFTPASLDTDLLLFAGGSGITPVISIAKTALAEGSGRVVLLYANRDESSVIFAEELRALAEQHAERLTVVHWLETVQGLPTPPHMKAFAAHFATYEAFACGPGPFMKGVIGALKELEFPRDRRHQEKFVSLAGNPFGEVEEVAVAAGEIYEAEHEAGETPDSEGASSDPGAPQGPVHVEVELDGQHHTFDDWPADKPLLDHLLAKGIPAPFSCREGNCSACAFRLLEGEVKMEENDILDDEDIADGIRLGCQALPTTDVVKVTYS